MKFQDRLEQALLESITPALPPDDRKKLIDKIVDEIYEFRELSPSFKSSLFEKFKRPTRMIDLISMDNIEIPLYISIEKEDEGKWEASGMYDSIDERITIFVRGIENEQPDMNQFRNRLDEILMHEMSHFHRDMVSMKGNMKKIPYVFPPRSPGVKATGSRKKYSRQPVESDAIMSTIINKFKEKSKEEQENLARHGVLAIAKATLTKKYLDDFDTPKWRTKIMKRFHREGIPVRKW